MYRACSPRAQCRRPNAHMVNEPPTDGGSQKSSVIFQAVNPEEKKSKFAPLKAVGGGGRRECGHVNRAEGFSVLKLSVILQHSGNFPCFVYHAQLCPVYTCHLSQGRRCPCGSGL